MDGWMGGWMLGKCSLFGVSDLFLTCFWPFPESSSTSGNNQNDRAESACAASACAESACAESACAESVYVESAQMFSFSRLKNNSRKVRNRSEIGQKQVRNRSETGQKQTIQIILRTLCFHRDCCLIFRFILHRNSGSKTRNSFTIIAKRVVVLVVLVLLLV